ncbi:MAG: MFS transporter, partial [Clostridia bacterium]|nr:MFS transporter [Clostridia bacterium]
ASAMTQVPFFFFAGLLAKVSLRLRYVLMTAFSLGLILICLVAKSPLMVIMGSVVFNIGYGIMMPTMREVTEKVVPENLRNLGHNLSDSVLNSLAAMASLVYAGVVMDNLGITVLLVLCAMIASAGLVVVLMGKKEYEADA